MRHRLRRSSLIGVSLLLAGSALSASCDAAKRVSSKTVAVNMLLDLGDPFDLAPRRTEVVSNLMGIEGPVDAPEANAITNATVTLEIEDVVTTIPMPMASDGVYQASGGTGGNPALVYNSGASYTIEMDVPSGSHEGRYTTRVTAPPRTNVTGLPDTLGGDTHPVNTPLTLSLTGSYDRGLVLVLDSSGNVVYDNRPTDVQSAIDFVFGDFDGTIEIPGSVLSEPNTFYGLVIAGLESAPSSGIDSDLNILSRFYAGSGKTAVIRTSN